MLPTIPLDYNLDFVMCEGGDRGSKKSQIADIMGCGFLMRPTLVSYEKAVPMYILPMPDVVTRIFMLFRRVRSDDVGL